MAIRASRTRREPQTMQYILFAKSALRDRTRQECTRRLTSLKYYQNLRVRFRISRVDDNDY